MERNGGGRGAGTGADMSKGGSQSQAYLRSMHLLPDMTPKDELRMRRVLEIQARRVLAGARLNTDPPRFADLARAMESWHSFENGESKRPRKKCGDAQPENGGQSQVLSTNRESAPRLEGSPEPDTLVLPPGRWLRLIGAFACSPKAHERVIEPLLGDFAVEWAEAGDCRSKALWIRVRYIAMFTLSLTYLGLSAALEVIGQLRKLRKL